MHRVGGSLMVHKTKVPHKQLYNFRYFKWEKIHNKNLSLIETKIGSGGKITSSKVAHAYNPRTKSRTR
jgi:hypothetical protein